MIEIITIGDEILIGQIVDTNSAWMSAELNKAGFPVSKITSIHDEEEQILEALDTAFSANKVVLLTGGLGPTKDDITKQVLCRFFETELVFSEEVYKHIEALFKHRPSVMNELTRSQAMVPENSTIIQNTVGTAPIMWFEKDGKVVISMPGVPFEMKKVMQEEVIGRLKERFSIGHILHHTVQVYGYGESALALKISDWEAALPAFLHLAYLPNFGIVRLRLSGELDDEVLLRRAVEEQLAGLKKILGESIIAQDDLPIEYTLADMLKREKLTISTAESCTGGNIAHRLTLLPGASDYFRGSVVAYHNDLKNNLLEVSMEDLEKYGAVSAQVVEQMALGVRKSTQSDLAVAVSGIAGPTGGSEDKPIGTVWIGLASKNGKVESRKYQFGSFPREVIIERTTTAAMIMVIEELNS